MTPTAIADRPAVLDPADVRREVLPNGLTVLLRRDASAPVVAIVTYVKAGYFDEADDVVGIAHVLEHMFFKGTVRRGVGEIARQTKASGGVLNAHTIYDHTSYYTVLPSAAFVEGLDIQFDAYAHSVIDAGELAKELEVIIQEAKRKSDSAAAVTTETLYEMLHDRHRMRRWRMGREPGLRALTQAQLLRFYREHYRPANTILCIVGDVDPGEALAEVIRRHGTLPAGTSTRDRGPDEPERHEFRWRELSGDVQQSQVAFGWRTVPAAHADAPLLDVAAAVLATGRASRLYRAVRERQLATGVSAYNYSPGDVGVFVVHAEAPPEKAVDAARALWAELRRLREEGVHAHELERARRIFEARWVRRLESMDGQANHLAEWEAEGDHALGERYLERLLTATADEVTAAARRWLDPEAMSSIVYRPEGAPALAADAAAFRALLDADPPAALPARAARAADGDATGAPPATFEREEAGVRVYRTSGGVPILIRRKAGTPIVHMGLYALGGARLEPAAQAGLTSLLVRTAIKGTVHRTADQLAEDAELLGGSVTPGLTSESFGWGISVPTRHLAAASALLADVVQRPTFPAAALETERAIALADLAAARDDMYRWPMRLATEAAFAGHPYGVPASGTEASLAGIAADAVRAWHGTQVLHGATVLALVGDVDPDAAAARLASDFAALRWQAPVVVPAPTWPAGPMRRAEPRDKAQSAIALLFPGPSRRDPRRHAAHLVAGIASGLGGRFFDELRDRQSLAYTVQAFASERELAGTFVAYIATSPDKEGRARRGLLAEFARLREELVTEDELQRAQTYALGVHAIQQQSGGSVLGDIVDAWFFDGDLGALERHEQDVRGVTRESIRALARECFDERRLVEGVIEGTGRAV